MSYKTELQNNNTRLRGVVDKINALPDYVEPSGGGGMGVSARSNGVAEIVRFYGGRVSVPSLTIRTAFVSVADT